MRCYKISYNHNLLDVIARKNGQRFNIPELGDSVFGSHSTQGTVIRDLLKE